MTCKDNRDGSCTVEYIPTEAGEYDISIKFAEQPIPGSPFKVPPPLNVVTMCLCVEPPGLALGHSHLAARKIVSAQEQKDYAGRPSFGAMFDTVMNRELMLGSRLRQGRYFCQWPRVASRSIPATQVECVAPSGRFRAI